MKESFFKLGLKTPIYNPFFWPLNQKNVKMAVLNKKPRIIKLIYNQFFLLISEKNFKVAVFIRVILLDQTFVHCPIFLTAGRKFSLDLISVPVWLIVLKDQLKIEGLVNC